MIKMTKKGEKISFEESVERTRELAKEFKKRGQGFSKESRFIDMVEEVGELAQAMLIVSGKKVTNDPTKQRSREDVIDALCDVLFDLVILADDYEADLVGEYGQMLGRLSERLESGEYDKS